MIPFPNISPEIFSVDLFGINIALRWYALSYLVGFFCAIKIMKAFIVRDRFWYLSKPVMKVEQADALLTYLILGVIIGGRLGYVLFYNLRYYVQNPFDVLRVWDGGMAFHGGFIGVVLAAILFCRFNSIPLWSGADLIAISSPQDCFWKDCKFAKRRALGSPYRLALGRCISGRTCSRLCWNNWVVRAAPMQHEAGLEGLLFCLF